MNSIIVAFDSFKGSLTSIEAGRAFAQGWHEALPECEVRILSISDGGEGMTEAIAHALGGECVEVVVSDPLCRPIKASYLVVNNGSTAVISMSSAAGLTLLSAEERNPLITTTYGCGEMVADAIARGCRKIIMGLGGSATNDAGVGMLRALGYKFYDVDGKELTTTMDALERVVHISSQGVLPMLHDVEFVVAADVDSPLFGERGAAYVFAPQKGADAEGVERLDRALQHFAKVAENSEDTPVARGSGMGAAGGMGYAMKHLLGARMERGIELVLDVIGFDAMVASADLVITGEGRIDRQTLMGKAPSGVLHRAQRYGVPCVAIGGGVASDIDVERSGFKAIYAATPHAMPLEEAMRSETASINIRNTAVRIAQEWLATQ